MRLIIIAACVGWFSATAASAEDTQIKISGPASTAIAQYLSTKTGCPDSEKTDCTLASIADEVQVFYGTFPGDPAQFAVAFVTTDSGGSGANLSAVVLKAETGGTFVVPRGTFVVFGHVDGIWGAEPRRVRFGAGHTISYIGTVMKPGDSHANATGKAQFRLTIGDVGISFSAD